jgi:L-lactate dehydrogenase complex protein LldG
MNQMNHSLDSFIKNLQAAGGEIAKETDYPDALDFTGIDIWAEYAVASLEKLNTIEQVIIRGNFGVAENGAIWLEDKDLPNRLIPFITQHLILQLDAGKIVPTMQEAYKQIRLSQTGFGVFISGPSKTADIEQSLVYGAHGAEKLSVILI